MTTNLTKFSDLIKNTSTSERIKLLDDIKAAAPSLPLHDLKALSAALSEVVKAEDAKTSAKTKRLALMQASIEDPAKEPAIKFCAGRLRALGLDLNQISASADVASVDRAMKEKGWTGEQRLALKTGLSRIGAIE